MLNILSVRQFAVVEQIEIDVSSGMTVLTGETGAGKSLLVDALMLLSGTRADAGMIRAGAKRAELSAEFDLLGLEAAKQWLTDNELDEDDDTCHLRRVIRQDGRSRAFINGRPATVRQLNELTPKMLEIHGQHAHQMLLSRMHQLNLLDHFADNRVLLEDIKAAVEQWHQLDQEQRELTGGEDRQSRMELLRHELAQLEQWGLDADALEALEKEHKRLANTEELLDKYNEINNLINSENEISLQNLIAQAETSLQSLVALDTDIQPIAELVTNANIAIGEAASSLQHYVQTLETNPERYSELDAHLGQIHQLSRRYGVAANALKTIEADHRQQLDKLENAGTRLAEIEQEKAHIQSTYQTLAQKLSQCRAQAANTLEQQVTTIMQQLGMTGGKLSIALSTRSTQEMHPKGLEQCELMVSANPGQPERALRKVASGGELARISLAIKVATLGLGEGGTMVFDEVDSGIGGAVAEAVGQKLRHLGEKQQVLCVTHLPQVAAQGHHHLSIAKHTQGKHTVTSATPMDTHGRIDELARMLGGIHITTETRVHAQKMLEQAQQ